MTAPRRTKIDDDSRGIQAFKAIRIRKAPDEVAAVLCNAIVGGLYGLGDLLPRERDLAERLHVSRSVVSEGIHILRRAGIISVRRGNSGGAVVESLANVRQVLSGLYGDDVPTMRPILEARRPLEVAAAVYVALRASPEEMAHLRTLVDALAGLLDQPTAFLSLDAQFHHLLGTYAHSEVLREALHDVSEKMLAALAQYPVGHIVSTQQAYEIQQTTMAALERRDVGEVESAMDEHLAVLETQFLGHTLPWQ